MNRTKDPPIQPLLAKRVKRPHLRVTIDGIKAMSRGISGRQTSHKICQYEYIVFTVCCEGVYGRYCIEKSDNNLSTFCHYLHKDILIIIIFIIIIIIIIIFHHARIVQQWPKPRPKSDHPRLPR